MGTTGYVHILGDPAEPCTLGVQFRKLAWHLTPTWVHSGVNGNSCKYVYRYLMAYTVRMP